MLEAVIFDCDGILVDSEKVFYKAVRATFLEYGIDISREDYIKRWMIEQSGIKKMIEDYSLRASISDLRQRRDSILQELSDEIKIIEGASELVQRFYGRYKLGVVSSSHRSALLKNLDKFALTDNFLEIISFDDIKNRKPNPEPYLNCIKLLNANASNTLVVEDNPTGVLSAKRAGCKVIAYPNGFSLGMDFELADHVVESLNEVDEKFALSLFKK